jgi:hypothetical protein
VKLTLKSSEPIENAMRVVGALYGVTLMVAPEKPESEQPLESPGPARSLGLASNAEVRSWARANGLTVNERGRIPASVQAAYRDAHPL